MIKTDNFNPQQDPKLLCTCNHPDCDERSVNQETLDKLQLVREWLNSPMYVTSGGRCPKHKNEQHRSKPADHQKCIGVDVFYKSEEECNLIMLYGARAGFTAIARGKNFVHLGNRPQKHFSTWSYS
ncbi:endolysin [Vibrio phage 1.245.O._10N.261.54.C7]|uniref:Hedgehog signaling/DD-peptidase zinc-binding domain protein n=1 Tax=Vibrio phage 1.245.O._10N.261.54.C7 TaxID=1881236 RepID=A0A2I7RWA0_9CAUD|nr:endolysin [Vibrio phage 1.245.O._10N.261.54.C7]AUR97938.1 hedgehog signaling/DD-peptidase zinc-binding domain protein [Vibrio phage 1.245.O._10N.261.54.C7]